MLEIYSKNITVAADAPVTLNSVALLKGTSTVPLGASSIQLTKCGVYEVSVSYSVVGSAAGVITTSLRKNGVVQPQATASLTAADATSILSTSFTTLVQVPENSNINCPCSIPTVIDVFNDGIEATYNTFDITVVRVQFMASVEEIFSKLASHMIEGLMMHDQLASYFLFLNLNGYAI